MKTTDQILSEAADTFRTRNANYKSNYLMVGQLMAALFPDGITLKTAHDHNRFHLFMLMMVKVSRYAIQWNNPHQDSIRDACVYAAMVEMIDGLSKELPRSLVPKFKIGDAIRVTEDFWGIGNHLSKGELATIKKLPISPASLYEIENVKGTWFMDEERMELVK